MKSRGESVVVEKVVFVPSPYSEINLQKIVDLILGIESSHSSKSNASDCWKEEML